jgi:hypothetical protein
MEELQLEIHRLRRENTALRHRLTATNQFMAMHVQMNVEQEHQLTTVNGHFDRCLELIEGLIKAKANDELAEAFAQAINLLKRA